MNITILDDYHDVIRNLDAFKKIADKGYQIKFWNDHVEEVDALAERLKDTDVLVTIRERTPVRAPLIAKLSKLKLISQRGVTPHIDTPALTEHGIILSSSKHAGQPSYATAELALGLMISAMRQIPQQMASLKAGTWQTALGVGMRGRTLGIYGYGKIGAAVAGYGKALGMKVLVWGRETTMSAARKDGYGTAASKKEFFSQCDVISLHVRLVPETRGMVTAADLACMKPVSWIINTSRSGLIEAGALEAALRAGRPGGAGIDVYDNEPITTTDHPLFALPNVVCTPHIGYVEHDAFEIQFGLIFDQINAYATGTPIEVVNPEVLKHARK